jgi:hypothetical protein
MEKSKTCFRADVDGVSPLQRSVEKNQTFKRRESDALLRSSNTIAVKENLQLFKYKLSTEKATWLIRISLFPSLSRPPAPTSTALLAELENIFVHLSSHSLYTSVSMSKTCKSDDFDDDEDDDAQNEEHDKTHTPARCGFFLIVSRFA